MKLPIQVAPVQRNFGIARYAMSGGINPSENLCSCNFKFLTCILNWNHCPNGFFPICSPGAGACLCSCCNTTGLCIGPFE